MGKPYGFVVLKICSKGRKRKENLDKEWLKTVIRTKIKAFYIVNPSVLTVQRSDYPFSRGGFQILGVYFLYLKPSPS
jgi:hypothetical protein